MGGGDPPHQHHSAHQHPPWPTPELVTPPRSHFAQKGLGEDVGKDKQDELQKAIKKYEGEVESLVKQRETEILSG